MDCTKAFRIGFIFSSGVWCNGMEVNGVVLSGVNYKAQGTKESRLRISVVCLLLSAINDPRRLGRGCLNYARVLYSKTWEVS